MAGFAFPNFQRLVTDFIGLNQFGIDQVRSVEWGKKHLWAVRFINDMVPPKPFDTFFPASDITFIEANLDSYNFEQGQSSYKVPQRNNGNELSLTFYDDNQHTLLRWIKNWINIDILNDGQFVSCLKDRHAVVRNYEGDGGLVYPTRTLEFVKLDESLVPIDSSYQVVEVYPEGTIEYQGSSASEVNQYTVSFVVVGYHNKQNNQNKETGVLATAKRAAVQTLGRFF